MCTVTFIEGPLGRVLTSNRDEHVRRAPAYPPVAYSHNGHTLWYPKDPAKGGTWVASRDDGWLAVLLNGAHTPFEPSETHRKSRGHVVLNVLGSERPAACIRDGLVLSDTAPFTLVLSYPGFLLEMRWDGSQREVRELDPNRPGIWSSATLYTPEMAARKKQLFENFLKGYPESPSPGEIREFHKGRYQEEGNDFLITRANGIQTVSITQACPDSGGEPMEYWVPTNRKVESHFRLVPGASS